MLNVLQHQSTKKQVIATYCRTNRLHAEITPLWSFSMTISIAYPLINRLVSIICRVRGKPLRQVGRAGRLCACADTVNRKALQVMASCRLAGVFIV